VLGHNSDNHTEPMTDIDMDEIKRNLQKGHPLLSPILPVMLALDTWGHE
jgi:hypothetical protein